MAIKADVVNGELNYNYTDSSKKNQNVGSNLGYDQFLQLLCAEMQYQDPMEPTSNTDYVAQLATFSQLEATLSLEDSQSSALANNLVGKQVILKTENANGATTYVDGRVDYVMYQEGKIKLAVNNGLYDLSQLDTVADSDYYEAIATAKSINSMISSLPSVDNLTTAYGTAIQQVRDLYNGLTDYQKGVVDEKDLVALTAYENRIAELKKIEEAKAEAEAAKENKDSEDVPGEEEIPEEATEV